MTDTINKFGLSVKRFLKSEDGPTAVEYAVMVALIIVACLTAVQALSTSVQTEFNGIAATLGENDG